MARRAPAEGSVAATTRQRIIEAATVAFAAKGYADTKVSSDVLRPAGISVGSFYHQFADKQELFAAVVEESATAAQRALGDTARRHATDDQRDRATATWRATLEMIDAFEPLYRIHLRERLNRDPAVATPLQAVKDTWAAALASAYRREALPDGFPIEAATEQVMALSLGITQLYLDRDPTERLAERDALAERLAAFTVGGMIGLYRRSHPPEA
jgi:AcrR family transcriptional regulator